MTHLRTNVSVSERLISVAGGAALLYDTIINRKASLLQTVTGTYLLLRGVTGFCLAYDRLGKKRDQSPYSEHQYQNFTYGAAVTRSGVCILAQASESSAFHETSQVG